MAIPVTKEPDGMPFIELCRSCQKGTRYWAEDGRYPLCPTCAARATEREKE